MVLETKIGKIFFKSYNKKATTGGYIFISIRLCEVYWGTKVWNIDINVVVFKK